MVAELHAVVLVLPCYAWKMPFKMTGSRAKYLLSTRGLLIKISTIILTLCGILVAPRPTQTGLMDSLTIVTVKSGMLILGLMGEVDGMMRVTLDHAGWSLILTPVALVNYRWRCQYQKSLPVQTAHLAGNW